jgi:SAM-dependent methyltransferase
MKRLRIDIKDYFKGYGTVSSWWNPEEGELKFHYEKEIILLEENFKIKSNWSVLDVGTGKGRFAIWLAKKGCKVIGLDISEEMLKIAKENAKKEGVSEKIDFILGDAETLSNFKQEFNVICCMELFDHLPNISTAIREMADKLVSGGYFLFTYVSKDSVYWKFGSKGYTPSFARAYDTNSLLEILKVNGIRVDSLFGIGLLFPVRVIYHFSIPIWICKLEKILKPYYQHPFFVKRCTHVVGIGVKDG